MQERDAGKKPSSLKGLPRLRDLVIGREASCHDRRGGNDNGFSNQTEFVRRGVADFGDRLRGPRPPDSTLA